MNNMRNYLRILEDTARFYKEKEEILIFEIGVSRGYSTSAFLKGLSERKGKLYSIDIDENCYKIVNRKGNIEKWNFIAKNSNDLDWNKEIDILLIDGDHSYEGVKKDFNKYVPFVKKDGIIFMHDVLFSRYGVKDFWKEIKYPKVFFNFNSSGIGIVQKK